MERKGRFMAWVEAENDLAVENQSESCTWNYAQRITEPEKINLTMEEALKICAEAKGVDVELVNILER